MTSTVSFRKELRDNMRERIWLFAIILAVGILLLPVAVFLEIQDASLESVHSNIVDAFRQTAGLQSGYMGAAVSVAAGMASVSGFSWLGSQERNDLMHSLPVSRERIFAVIYTSGAVLCIAPYLICQIFAALVVPLVNGCFQGALAVEGLKAAAFFILAFLSVYSVFCLGMILSGRTGIGAALGIFILVIGPAVYWLVTILIHVNFSTVLIAGNSFQWMLSPVALAVSGPGKDISTWAAVVGLAVWAVACLILDCRIYAMRPSEKAGSAFIFRWISPVLQIILMAFGGFGLGLMFGYYNSTSPSYALFITGAAVGCLVVWIISELVFYGKIRHFRKKCRLIAGAFGGTILIFLMFALDPLHVDQRIPDADHVQAMGLWSDSLDYLYMTTNYTSGTEYRGFDERISDVLITDFEPMYEMAQEAASSQDAESDIYQSNHTEEAGTNVLIDIGWKLKSGRMVYREYSVSDASLEKMWDDYRDSDEFDENYNPFRKISVSDIHSVSVYSTTDADDNTEFLDLDEGEKQELVDALAEDFRTSRPTELLQSYYQVALDINEWSENTKDPLMNITVYDSYKNTMAFLQSHGAAEVLNTLNTDETVSAGA